jgi:hypothetical protein
MASLHLGSPALVYGPVVRRLLLPTKSRLSHRLSERSQIGSASCGWDLITQSSSARTFGQVVWCAVLKAEPVLLYSQWHLILLYLNRWTCSYSTSPQLNLACSTSPVRVGQGKLCLLYRMNLACSTPTF